MPLDASIFSQARQPQISSTNALMQALQIHGQQRQNALADSQIAEQQATVEERGRLRNALMGGARPDTPEGLNALVQAAPNLAPNIGKAYADMRQANAKASAEEASAGKTTSETKRAAWTQNLQQLGAVSDPASLQAWVSQSVQDGHMPMQMAQGIVQQAQQNPQAFGQVKQGLLMTGMESLKQLELTKPQVDYKNAGGSLVPVQTNAYAGTPQAVGSAVPIPVTQDENNRATVNATLAGQRSVAATAAAGQRSVAATAHEGHLIASGMAMPGQPDENFERTAQAVASGQLAPPTGMALTNPKNQRLLGRVMEINPTYDFTDVTAKKTAAAAFTTGKEGAAMRSFSVAGQHLEQLGQLADALDNGNMQIINKVSQAIAQQTGSAAPTNFDATKQIVAKEVVKAIVAGGGGVDERKALEETLSRAKSPAQLKGVITQFSNLMAAQHDALLQQRRAAGLSDSTLPTYHTPNATAAASGTAGQTTDLGNGFSLKH